MNAKQLLLAEQELESAWFNSYGDESICLFKEAFGGGRWNHANAIRKDNGLLKVSGGANQAMHYRTIEWLYALESTFSQKEFDIERERLNNYPEARKVMLRSSWINLKKVGGKSNSNVSNLITVIRRDHELLLQQVQILSPRVVLCGNTFAIIRNYLFPDVEKIAGTEFSYIDPQGTIIVDSYHPGRKPKDSYNWFVTEAKKIGAAGVIPGKRA